MKKGFSIIVLTIAVLVVLILTTTAIFGVVNYQNKVNKLEFALELARVQTKVDIYYKNNNRYPLKELDGIVSIDISGFSEEQKSQFSGETVESNQIALNYIDMNLIFDNKNSNTDELHSLKYGNALRSTQDVYALSTETGKVYYLASFKGDYTLTEELKELIGYSDELSTNSTFGIIFSKSTEEYTSLPVITEVKIPADYELVECKLVTKTADPVDLTYQKEENGYKFYTTPNDINEEYDIIVKCKQKDSEDIMSTYYSVANFDTEAPNIEVVGKVNKITDNTTGESRCIYFIDYSDNKSGIDLIKYAEFKIVADDETDSSKNLEVIKKYFETDGNSVLGNKIEFNEGVRWLTIYVKDKAGNENYIYKQVPQVEKTATNEYDSIYEE